jgi:hypothetical protein
VAAACDAQRAAGGRRAARAAGAVGHIKGHARLGAPHTFEDRR